MKLHGLIAKTLNEVYKIKLKIKIIDVMRVDQCNLIRFISVQIPSDVNRSFFLTAWPYVPRLMILHSIVMKLIITCNPSYLVCHDSIQFFAYDHPIEPSCWLILDNPSNHQIIGKFSRYPAQNAAIWLADEVLRNCDHDTSGCQDDISWHLICSNLKDVT